MDKVKMWTIEWPKADEESKDEWPKASPVPSGGMDSEEHLEKILVKNPELLMPGLTLVGRLTPTKSGPLDLLGVDRCGRLVVFELKKGTASRDAIAQIIDYASALDAMDLDTLVKHISDKSGAHGIGEVGDSEEWYAENLGMEDLESLKSLRMFLVGLGADDRTKRMVNFLAKRGVDISLLTFYSFTYKGKTLLARCVHQEDSVPARRKKLSSQEYRDALYSRAEKHGVSDQFNDAKKMFRENWCNPGKIFYSTGLCFSFPNIVGTKARLNVKEHDGRLEVTFFFPAIRLCINKFEKYIKEIPSRTKRKVHEDNAREDLNTALEKTGYLEIQFLLTETDWETHKEKLNELTHAVYDAQQREMQGD